MNDIPTIVYLSDEPRFIDEVAQLWHREWGNGTDEEGLTKQRLSVQRKANKRCIPFILICLDADILMGAVAVFEQDLDTLHTPEPWLAAVVTKPEYRNRQVARRLVDTALKECKSLGINKVYLRTETAMGYWHKLGWAFLVETIDEAGSDTYVFSKEL